MAEKPVKKKGTQLSPVAHWSPTLYKMFFLSIYLTIGLAIISLFFKPIVMLAHWLYDDDSIFKSWKKMNEMSNGFVKDYVPSFFYMHTTTWGDKIEELLDFSPWLVLGIGFSITLLIALTYVATIFLRHRHGEHAPWSNDAEARRLKRRLLMSTNAYSKTYYDEDKEVRRLEKAARYKIRRMKVYIHTTLQKGQVKPTKRYLIRVRRHNNIDVNKRLEAKIKGLDEVLNSFTGINFGQQATSSDWRYYEFGSSVETERKEARSVRKKRLKKERANEQGGSEMETSFPLSLFVDNTDKIESQTEKAQEYADKIKLDVRNYMASIKVPTELSNVFTGATSVQLTFKLQFTTNLPNMETLANGLDNALNTRGILAKLSAGNIDITIPLPEDSKIPIDTKSMIQKSKSKTPTSAIFGMAPDDSLVEHAVGDGPHFLMAGTTGSGKSVSINTILITMLARMKPDDLKLAIVDPKTVEFTAYKDLPYMIANPIVDLKDANEFMLYLTHEMDRRYKILADNGVKKLAEYDDLRKEKPELEKLPYIVLVIDEFSDLIGQYKEVEKPIVRIGQKARAAGIHMIIATQSPRREVITGLIKANVPSRLSLMVASSIESQIILDETGSEKLRPRGDFLLKMNGGQAVRGQAPYISNEEIDDIFKYLRENYPKPEFVDFKKILAEAREADGGGDADGLEERASRFRGGSRAAGPGGRSARPTRSGAPAPSRAAARTAPVKEGEERPPKRVSVDTSKYADKMKPKVRTRKGVDPEEASIPEKTEKVKVEEVKTVSAAQMGEELKTDEGVMTDKGVNTEEATLPPKTIKKKTAPTTAADLFKL